MTDYKLVPVESAPEMVDAAADAYMPFGDMDLAIRMAILAAPAVQGEPVAYAVFADNGNIRIWCADPIQAKTLIQEYGDQVLPLYTAPQPVEQQPECGCCGQTDRCDDGCDAVVIGGHRAAEQQPDVTHLVEALERIANLPIDPCKTQNDYRLSAAKAIALAAASSYRKGG
ncbi:hypothetical protein [Halopseudomonas bauzanensis]|uniref:hypothetical protein n=1 Tax=Halopseudomonas bauzanensis TaxID=653930 RepID=UPI0025567CDA|nr:hypothetical protein [Halopseudomonas bauzanensis]